MPKQNRALQGEYLADCHEFVYELKIGPWQHLIHSTDSTGGGHHSVLLWQFIDCSYCLDNNKGIFIYRNTTTTTLSLSVIALPAAVSIFYCLPCRKIFTSSVEGFSYASHNVSAPAIIRDLSVVVRRGSLSIVRKYIIIISPWDVFVYQIWLLFSRKIIMIM